MSKLLSCCPLRTGSHLEQLYEASDPHYGIPGLVSSRALHRLFAGLSQSDVLRRGTDRLVPNRLLCVPRQGESHLWKERAKRALGYWQGTKDPHFDKPGRFLDIGVPSDERGFQFPHYAGTVGSLQIWLNRKNGKESSEGSLYDNRALRVVSGWVENLCDLIRIGDMIAVTAVKARSRASQAPSGVAQPA